MVCISVIIPVFNKEDYVAECINSVIGQDLDDIELIVIDDGSTDDSLSVVKKIADPRIKVIAKKNTGVGDSRNIGIRESVGKYVCFMDPDDFYPENDVLSSLYNNAESNGVQVCGGSFSSLKDGNVITTYGGLNSKYTFHDDGIVDYDTYAFDYGFHRFIYLRSMLVDNDILFPNYIRFQDPPFFVKAMTVAKRFYAIKKVVYRYREAYKEIQWNFAKKIDLLKGMRDCVIFAEDNTRLKELTATRLMSNNEDMVKRNGSRFEATIVARYIDDIRDRLPSDSLYREGLDRLSSEVTKNVKNDKKTFFSIVVPVYNVAAYIDDCLQSLIDQDYKDYEIICVDDGSPDNSGDICESYAKRFPFVKVIHRFNGGLSEARNTGADFSNGEYLYFIDSDDMLAPNVLSEIHDELVKNDLDLMFFDAITLNESDDGKVNQSLSNSYSNRMEESEVMSGEVLLRTLMDCNAYRSPVQLSMIRSKFYFDIGIHNYPGILHEDNLYTVQALMAASRAKYVPRPYYVRRIRDDSIMTSHFTIRNFKGYMVVASEIAAESKKEQDADRKMLLNMMRDRPLSSAKVVFENLDYSEKEKLNNITEVERIRVGLCLPFTKPSYWKKTDWIAFLVYTHDLDDDVITSRIWDADCIRGDGVFGVDNVLNEIKTKCLTNHYMVAVDGHPREADDIAFCIFRAINEGSYDSIIEWNGVRLIVHINDNYIPTPSIRKTGSGNKSDLTDILKDLYEKDSSFAYALCSELLRSEELSDWLSAMNIAMENYKSDSRLATLIGSMYSTGKCVEKNDNLAMTWFDIGHKQSALEKAVKERSFDVVFDDCKLEANNGNPFAAYYIFRSYYEGRNVEKDTVAAMNYGSMFRSGQLSDDAKETFEALWAINSDESAHCLMEYVLSNGKTNSRTRYILGDAYYNGIGVPKDLNLAAQWMRKAFEADNKYRVTYLRMLWENHSDESIEALFSLCSKEVYCYDALSVRYLARIYGERGEYFLAKERYRQALGMRPDLTIYEYIEFLFRRNGHDDLAECFTIAQKYSGTGNKDALFWLGILYLEGKGIHKDRAKGIELLKMAADAGSNSALVELEKADNNNGILGTVFRRITGRARR